MLERVHRTNDAGTVDAALLREGAALTDANGAIFDAAHAFAGCIPGIHEVLRRQGLLRGIWCLDPDETLSPGQSEEIDRVIREHPELVDDDFVKENLERWMGG
jgi:hypothetical protein